MNVRPRNCLNEQPVSKYENVFYTSGSGSGPEDGQGDGDDARGDEDPGEVVGPGQVEVDGPAEETEWDGEECTEHDAPVLVVEEVLLVLLVVLVGRAGVVGLHQALGLGSGNAVEL